MLVGCVSFAGDPIGCVSCLRARLLWLPPRVAFFSYIGDTHCYCSSMSSPSHTIHSLSAEGHSCSYNNTRSFSSEGHSLDLCAQISLPACPVRRHQLRALWGSRLIFLFRKPALQQAGRPRVRRQKGPADVDHTVLRAIARPWRHLRSSSSQPCSPCRKSLSRWKLIAPFYEILQLF
jgi:hypothetical protein